MIVNLLCILSLSDHLLQRLTKVLWTPTDTYLLFFSQKAISVLWWQLIAVLDDNKQYQHLLILNHESIFSIVLSLCPLNQHKLVHGIPYGFLFLSWFISGAIGKCHQQFCLRMIRKTKNWITQWQLHFFFNTESYSK